MAKVTKSKKAQYGEYLTQDRATGKYTLTTKANTPGGPRYYQSTSPNESTNRTINNFRARANSADSVRAKDIDPAIIKRLAEQKNGGKTAKKSTTTKAKDGKWIQKAINPKHKGYCTPMTKATCTPKRKALAMTLKKMAKARKGK
jgi:hypothetical protein